MPANFFREQFIDAIDRCRKLCVDHVVECYLAAPNSLAMESDDFFSEVQHRFNCVVVKAFVETAESDLVLTPAEAELAKIMVEHLLSDRVKPDRLHENFRSLAKLAAVTDWGTALEPMKWFDQTEIYFEEIKSGILRIANIAAKVDGHTRDETIAQLKMIRLRLDQHLPAKQAAVVSQDALLTNHWPTKPTPTKSDSSNNESLISDKSHQISQALIKMLDQDHTQPDAGEPDQNQELTAEQRDSLLREGMEELNGLIGIEEIRREIQTLINVCKLQQYRAAHSMPVDSISLHMVFTGNPGTGKTTVARIAAKLFGAIGIINRGHLIETDRSGIVAEFQGQTGPKTNAKIDDAIDGVLFIDEAYSLAPATGADSYGAEAIGTLLKRMEDDRDRLIVILAGYPQPMNNMLKSNPGLSSRFARRCHFPDYTNLELASIFDRLAQSQHYSMTEGFRTELSQMIGQRIAIKDEHFGNGRLMRNLFENAVRNLANRIVKSPELTPELLSTFQAGDLVASR